MSVGKTRIIRDLFWMTSLAMFALAPVACGSSGPGPEETVRAYYETVTAEDLEKHISLAVPERRDQVRDAVTRFGFPPGSYSDIRLETVSQSGDTATVTSKYDLKTTFQGKTVQGLVEEIFSLKKRSGEWLLASLKFSEPESVEFFVDDKEGNPVGGARVFVYNDQSGSWTAGVTDSRGNVVFESVRKVDRIWVFKTGMALANRGGWPQRFLREPHFVTLTRLSGEALSDSFREQVQNAGYVENRVKLLALDPPFLSVPQGGASQATAVLQSFDLEATVTLTLLTEPRAPIPQITLKSDPATIEVPLDGRTFLPFTFTVGPSLEPGIYELEISAEIIEFIQPDYEALWSGALLSNRGVSWSAGGITLLVEVTPPEPGPTPGPTPTPTPKPTPCGSLRGPESTVCSYYEALTTGDPTEEGYISHAVSLAAPELRQKMEASVTFFGRPLGSYSNLKLETVFHLPDTAFVNSYFELERTSGGRTFLGPVEETFSLEKRNGKWLVVSFEQVEPASLEFFVDDEQGNPVGGARVFVYTDESGSWSTGLADSRGHVVFEGVRDADRIWVFKAGMALATTDVRLTMRSIEAHVQSIRERTQIASVDILTLDPPFLSVPQGGTAQATAVLQSFGLKATVILILRTLNHNLVPQVTLRSDPATIDIPIDGRALFPFRLTVAPSVEPGIYELRLNADVDITKFRNDDDYAALLSREGGFSWSGGHTTIIVEVTPPGP